MLPSEGDLVMTLGWSSSKALPEAKDVVSTVDSNCFVFKLYVGLHSNKKVHTLIQA